MSRRTPALLVAAALVAGCSGYTVRHLRTRPIRTTSAPPAGHALVCVFRASAIGASLTTPVRDNGEVVGATEGPGHFCYHATPGRHTLTVEVSDASAFSFDAQPAQRVFVEHRINIGTDALVAIDEARALELEKSTVYAVVDAVPEGQPAPVSTATGH